MVESKGRAVHKVLLVDDVEVMVKAWTRECRRIRKVPLPATNRRDAIELARHHKPEMAVIDLLMPDDSGLEVVRELKTIGLDVFSILVSGAMCVDYAMLSVKAGADDCYDKSVSIAELVHCVEHGRRPDPDSIEVPTLAEVEWQHIVRVVNDCDGNITHAAQVLGEHRYTLQRKIHKHAGVLRRKRVRRKSSVSM